MPEKARAEHWFAEFGNVDIPESQAQERAERLDVKERRFQGYSPVKGIVVPELPWKKGDK